MARTLNVEYKMRMSSDLKDKISQAAKENNRSMNAEIVKRLEDSFDEIAVFDPKNEEMLTNFVAKSMEVLISNLSYEGIDSDKLINALKKTAK